MKNYLVINHFLNIESFSNLYLSLEKAFEKRGERVEILTNIQARKLLEKNGNNAPVLFFDKDVLLCKLLEKSGYKCVNGSFVIETCDDKAKTYAHLYNDFLMPKTILPPFSYAVNDYLLNDFLVLAGNELGYPLVVKQNKGSFGEQVHLVNDINELKTLVKSFNSANFLLQEFISSSAGKDLRVYVVGGNAVAHALRYSETDFRSNVTSGGKMKSVEGVDDYIEVAKKVANFLGADFVGVDLLFSPKGPMVCEVNSNAHFRALSNVTGVDVAQKIVDYYLSLR